MLFPSTLNKLFLSYLILSYIIDLLLCYSYSGSLDGFSFGCLNVGVYLSSSQGFSHICSLFRARLCWGVGAGGSVANEGLVLYIGGDYSLCLKCYVTCTICQPVR